MMPLETASAVVMMCVLGAVTRAADRATRWLAERSRRAALRAQAHLSRDAFVRELRKEQTN